MSIKTAISIKEPLFEQVKALASELNISRSRFFTLAVEEFIKRYDNQRLLDTINQAYDDLPNEADDAYLQKARIQHKKTIEGQW